MQAGFALVEAGLTRAKSVANIMMKNMMDFCVGVLAFAAVGFGLAFGGTNKWIGTEGWFLDADAYAGVGNLTLPTFFVFQVAFAATAATIVSGAMAERTKFKSYFLYSFLITAFIYPVGVHWVWGGGWLSQMDTPFHDFAGSTIVHAVGGTAALMGALFLGPRIGKYGPDGKPRAIPGHSIPYAIVGVFILWIGWFGFNPGSELAADETVFAVALTTLLAGAAGGVATTMVSWFHGGKPDVAMAGNGVLAGLVGITAGTAVVNNWGAVIIGLVAGVIVYFAVLGLDRVGVDDPVGAVSVHGICGIFGTLAVGLFAYEGNPYDVGPGLFMGGGAGQLVSQLIGVAAIVGFAAVATSIMFAVIKATIGLRVPEEEEIEGLDVVEHGSPGYGADFMNNVSSGGVPAASSGKVLTGA
jgi:Amt family ammonium transporter